MGLDVYNRVEFCGNVGCVIRVRDSHDESLARVLHDQTPGAFDVLRRRGDTSCHHLSGVPAGHETAASRLVPDGSVGPLIVGIGSSWGNTRVNQSDGCDIPCSALVLRFHSARTQLKRSEALPGWPESSESRHPDTGGYQQSATLVGRLVSSYTHIVAGEERPCTIFTTCNAFFRY